MKKIILFVTPTFLIMGIAMAGFFIPNKAGAVDPIFEPGNPTCANLGYALEYKLDPADPGTHTVYIDGIYELVINIDSNDHYISFVSEFPLDAVIAKGGPDANVYYYATETQSGEILSAPFNGDRPFGISHISFCYDYELDVSKTANTSYRRTHEWDITKTVSPANWDLPRDGSGTSDYTVTVNKTGYTDSDWMVEGVITISNNTPYNTNIMSVEDVMTEGITATVDCGVTFPYELVSGDFIHCSYTSNLPNASNRINTATVTTEGEVEGNTAEAPVSFANATVTEIDQEINVIDTNSMSWGPVSQNDSWTYTKTFDCSDETLIWTENTTNYNHNNTATIIETDQYDTALVTVNCYDYELEVTKTANTSYTRAYEWDITKTVSPANWDLFYGNIGTSEYEVSVNKTGYTDSDWMVDGTITIYNPAPFTATVVSVNDVIDDSLTVPVNCGVNFPYDLTGGETLTCSYTSPLTDATNRLNKAMVEASGFVQGNTAEAVVDFTQATITETNTEVNVIDSNSMSWGPVTENSSWTYTKNFDCQGETLEWSNNTAVYSHDNVATITETGQDDTATVNVNCYKLGIDKTAETFYNRNYNWNINKSGDISSVTLEPGQTQEINYSVVLTVNSQESGWSAAGTVSVYNPSPFAAEIISVDDIMDSSVVSLDCGTSFPYMLPAGENLTCNYDLSLADSTTKVNTASAAMQNYHIDPSKTILTPLGNTKVTAEVIVDFSNASGQEIDECVNVNDDKYGNLGMVCANDTTKTFNYNISLGTDGTCGYSQYVNTASFNTNDTNTTGNSTWIVDLEVPCADGCSLTPGYWKTHSIYGPAKYDATWAKIGEDTIFFLSGQSWYEVLQVENESAYYTLARAYIASTLNKLNGADVSEITDTLSAAESLFNKYTPLEVAMFKDKKDLKTRARFISLAATLDDYNNGIIGPGHCTDANTDTVEKIVEPEPTTVPTTFDTDNDGLNDTDELYTWGTDPYNPDTDGDGYLDGAEVNSGYNPLGNGSFTDDNDNDGLNNYDELYIWGTDPENADTDGDGYSDGSEVANGYNPLGKGKLRK